MPPSCACELASPKASSHPPGPWPKRSSTSTRATTLTTHRASHRTSPPCCTAASMRPHDTPNQSHARVATSPQALLLLLPPSGVPTPCPSQPAPRRDRHTILPHYTKGQVVLRRPSLHEIKLGPSYEAAPHPPPPTRASRKAISTTNRVSAVPDGGCRRAIVTMSAV